MMRTIFSTGIIILLLFNGLEKCIAANQNIDAYYKNISMAYAYYVSQEYSLLKISQKFPQLSDDVNTARFRFNSSDLMQGIKNIEKKFISIVGNEKTTKLKKDLINELDNNAKSLSINIAKNYIDAVSERAKGNIPDEILKTILRENDKFSVSPEQEFMRGWRQTFNTKGHKKAGSLDISISVPKSWDSREGYRPHIVQYFSRNYGDNLISVALGIHHSEVNFDELPQEEMVRLYASDEFKTFLPENAKRLAFKNIVIENIPAAYVRYEMEVSRLDKVYKTVASHYIVLYKSSLISIMCSNGTIEKNNNLEKIHLKFLPLFDDIANTLIINNIYNNN